MRAPLFTPRLVRNDILTFVALAIGLTVALLLAPVPGAARSAATKSAKPDADRLALTWVSQSSLRVAGAGFAPRSSVAVRLGGEVVQGIRADGTGEVSLDVPNGIAAAGKSGSSVIVSGRGSSGSARVLISAVPPPASARGPVDVLPWSLGGAVVAGVLIGALRRRTAKA